MTSTYLPFFSIELQHEYFLDGKCQGLEVVPAPDTLQAFRKMGVLYRTVNNCFTTLLAVNNTKQPAFNSPGRSYYRNDYAQTVFRLYLLLKHPLFANYTNLDRAFGRPQKYWFSNLAANPQQDDLPLSVPVAGYSAQGDYVPGDLVKETKGGTVYEALKKTAGRKKSDLADEARWAPKETTACVSGSDLVEVTGSPYLFRPAAPANQAEISVSGFNFDAASPAYDQPVLTLTLPDTDASQTVIPVSLGGLPPGRYLVKVNGETRMVYYDPAAMAGAVVGVIEIYNHLPGADPYALLTDAEELRAVTYKILFPARRVLWKFIRKDGKADSITDVGSAGYQFALRGNEFVSALPIPLSETPLKTLKLLFNTADYQLFPLPNPGVERLKQCEQDDYAYYCSEVYLNY